MDESAAPPIDSRASFARAVRWSLEQAFRRGARRIVCVDPDFAEWPLNEVELLEGLTAWLRRPQRELVLLAAQYDEVPRCHPRFVAWRRSWGHAVAAWTAPEDLGAQLPTLLLDDGPTLVRLIDRAHWRGETLLDAKACRLYRDEIDAVLQRAEPGFPVSLLGL